MKKSVNKLYTLISILAAFCFCGSALAQTIYVSKSGNNNNNGLSQGNAVLTIQKGLDLLKSNSADILQIGDGTYYESVTLSNYGSSSNRVWIKAENPGGAAISNNWQAADQGNVTWTADSGGGGVYYASRSSRPYVGSHENDFLMYYNSEADLRAASITTDGKTISKPSYGFAFESSQNRVYVRLRGNANPNGKSIKLTAAGTQTLLDMNNCDYVYVDGIKFEGAGYTRAIEIDNASSNCIIRNCEFTGSRFGARTPSNTTIEWSTYRYIGFDNWARDVTDLDGHVAEPVFTLIKKYYNAALIGVGGGTGNAMLEGSLNHGANVSPAPTNVVIENNLIGPCFDGLNLGHLNNSFARENVFLECLDDGIQNDDNGTSHPATGNRVHDNRFVDCHRDISVQGANNVGSFHIYRNLFIATDHKLSSPDFYSLKMNRASTSSSTYVYQNTWWHDFGQSANGAQRVWSDFGGISNANRIINFFNNVVVFPRDFSNGPGSDPQSIQNNAAVGPSSGAASILTGGGGTFTGTASSSMQLNSDYSLQSSSPARNIGRSLPSGFPDSNSNNNDAGVFPFGTSPGSNWPRIASVAFTSTPPPTFSSGSTPNAPTSLSATTVSSSQINLSWTDNSNIETGFEIDRKTGSGGTYSQIATPGANTTSFSNTGLSASTNYVYRVRATNSNGDSSNSNEASATTSSGGGGGNNDITVRASGSEGTESVQLEIDGTVVATWPVTTSFQDFVYSTAALSGDVKVIGTGLSGAGTAFIDYITADGVTYQGEDQTINTGVWQGGSCGGTLSDTLHCGGHIDFGLITFGTASPPAAPSSLAANSISSSQIDLSWTDNSSDETGFEIDRKTGSGGTYSQIASLGANVSSYSDTGLSSSTNYFYRVRATNANGDSGNSNESNATTSGSGGGSSVTYQGESASLSGGNVVESTNTGFNGTGYVNSSANGSTTFNNIDGLGGGSITLTIRYALGSADRTGNLIVNGGSPTSLTMTGTAAWTDYQTMTVNITLNSGTSNTIEFDATGSDFGNIDEITLTSNGGGGSNDIIVRARGSLGTESVELEIDGTVVATFAVSTVFQDFTYTTSATSGDVIVNGIDVGGSGTAYVDYVQADGVTHQGEDQVTNTGVWQNGSCGGTLSEALHCNGYIDFGVISF
ncbi:fibronectin type III domain-containing protein [Puniceicoccaceae bacterium K14]|nr:fibronectin type III domain-containing protein [Puniceicoccaceae bacterium K14]